MKNIYSIRPKGFNVGNDAIYVALHYFIRFAFKENFNVISLPATGKYEVHRKTGLSSQTIYEINQFGHGMIIGGGNLYENGELEVDPIALRALEKPMMIFSVSRGKVYNRALELVDRTDTMADGTLELLHQHATLSLSRDRATKSYLDSLGLDNLLGGCPTLFMNEIPQHAVPVLEGDKTDALISLRTPTLMSIPVEYQYRLREQLIEVIAVLREQGYRNVKFLCHDHRDIPFAASFEGMEYLYSEDIYTYLTYLRNTRLNVTFRLHSFIPCLAYGVPTIKISYDQRALSMLDTIGMDGWNINLLKDEVLTEFKARLDNLADLKSISDSRRKGVWKELRETMKESCERFAELVENR